MGTEDDEVYEIYHKLSEDDGKLVPAYKHAADVAWGNLADIHRTDGRCHTHSDTSENAVEVEYDKKRPGGLALSHDVGLWFHRTPCGEEEAYSREYQGTLATEFAGEQTGEGRTYDTSDKCA